MHVAAGFFAGDPPGVTALCGDASVEGLRQFEQDERQALRAVFDIGGIESAGFGFAETDFHFEARFFEFGKTLARDAFIGVLHRAVDASDAGGEHGFGARGGTAVEGTGLQGDIEIRAV